MASDRFTMIAPHRTARGSGSWAERALRIRERLLACGPVTGAIGCARPRHGLPDGLNHLW
jgi:hypothetical protein